MGLTLFYIFPYPTPLFFQTHRVVKPNVGWWLTARISNGSDSQWWVLSHPPHWSSGLIKLGNIIAGEWLLRTQMSPSLEARGTDLSLANFLTFVLSVKMWHELKSGQREFTDVLTMFWRILRSVNWTKQNLTRLYKSEKERWHQSDRLFNGDSNYCTCHVNKATHRFCSCFFLTC